ncbi:MAG TPA: hypothetical protein VF940_05775 [Streptosporangiaceae bacterium]
MKAHKPSVGVTLVALVSALTAGCDTNGQRNVFETGPGSVSESGPAHVDEIIDESVPLYNISDHPVRLRSIKIVGEPAAVRLLNVRAYNINKLGFGGLSLSGDLPAECPGQFVPRPIGSFTTAPHKDPDWMVVIAFRISKPGTYHLDKLRLSYWTNGSRGWQYEYLKITYKISNPPLPGQRPLPKSAVCDKP